MRANERVFVIGEDGVAILADEDLSVPVYFQDEGEMFDFMEWLEGEGSESFARYRESGKKLPELCTNCKWLDKEHDQCFNGHLQYARRDDCDGFKNFMEEDNDGV
jgi:hypothetical protein